MVHSEIKIRGYHLDMFRHVNNARYLEFLEEGRWAFFDATPDFFYRLKDVTFFVVNININYRRPATLGDVLDIQTRLSKIGNTSGVLRQEVYNKGTGELTADADITFVITDAKTQKPLNLNDRLKDVIAALMP
ncbi:MAG: thioesterase family protein [Deltaproteobacteria bacterium]|nr:thioesterase family protein [Deltaproteobacteria bacterium]